MAVNDPLKDLDPAGLRPPPSSSPKMIRLGMVTLRRSGLNKVAEGMTTLEEILEGVTASDT